MIPGSRHRRRTFAVRRTDEDVFDGLLAERLIAEPSHIADSNGAAEAVAGSRAVDDDVGVIRDKQVKGSASECRRAENHVGRANIRASEIPCGREIGSRCPNDQIIGAIAVNITRSEGKSELIARHRTENPDIRLIRSQGVGINDRGGQEALSAEDDVHTPRIGTQGTASENIGLRSTDGEVQKSIPIEISTGEGVGSAQIRQCDRCCIAAQMVVAQSTQNRNMVSRRAQINHSRYLRRSGRSAMR